MFNFWWKMEVPLEIARGIRQAKCTDLNWNLVHISDKHQGVFRDQMFHFKSESLASVFSTPHLLLPKIERTPYTEWTAPFNLLPILLATRRRPGTTWPGPYSLWESPGALCHRYWSTQGGPTLSSDGEGSTERRCRTPALKIQTSTL